jgi:hypothetical protein
MAALAFICHKHKVISRTLAFAPAAAHSVPFSRLAAQRRDVHAPSVRRKRVLEGFGIEFEGVQ